MRHVSAGWHLQLGAWLFRLELRVEDAPPETNG
jgi:hypothetical protein